jgi:hypothetical protein
MTPLISRNTWCSTSAEDPARRITSSAISRTRVRSILWLGRECCKTPFSQVLMKTPQARERDRERHIVSGRAASRPRDLLGRNTGCNTAKSPPEHRDILGHPLQQLRRRMGMWLVSSHASTAAHSVVSRSLRRSSLPARTSLSLSHNKANASSFLTPLAVWSLTIARTDRLSTCASSLRSPPVRVFEVFVIITNPLRQPGVISYVEPGWMCQLIDLMCFS